MQTSLPPCRHGRRARRRIAHWVLIEATGDYTETWIEVQESEDSYDTYHEAIAAGLLALQGQIANLDVGPQEAVPKPVKAAKHGGLFGIGLGATLRR